MGEEHLEKQSVDGRLKMDVTETGNEAMKYFGLVQELRRQQWIQMVTKHDIS
jgi:hypothetical protein